MKKRKAPAIIMLLAGLTSLIMTIIFNYDAISVVAILLIVLLVFYLIGLGATIIISRLTQESIDREELEREEREEIERKELEMQELELKESQEKITAKEDSE